jgi:hypothetical protein
MDDVTRTFPVRPNADVVISIDEFVISGSATMRDVAHAVALALEPAIPAGRVPQSAIDVLTAALLEYRAVGRNRDG